MKVDLFGDLQSIKHPNKTDDPLCTQVTGPVRLEVPLITKDEQQWKVILLDADDTFDVVIHYPTGEREAIFSLVKD